MLFTQKIIRCQPYINKIIKCISSRKAKEQVTYKVDNQKNTQRSPSQHVLYHLITDLWNVLRKIFVTKHLIVLKRILYTGLDVTVRIEYVETGWVQK